VRHKSKARVENPVQAIPCPTRSEAAPSQKGRSYWPRHSGSVGWTTTENKINDLARSLGEKINQ
jgi:hypothetical protein